ncbi:MAG TPA: hypothetical protein VLT33_48860 [Labilithrix sp.]|nr:hypothetical protein [Labilithrix sp.]
MSAARFRALGLVGLGVLTVAACGKEIGRIPLRDQGAGETTVQASNGKALSLWTSLDVKYSGAFAAHYDIEMLQGGALVGKTRCNPLDVSTRLSSKQTTFGNDHSMSWQGKMRCEIALAKGGPTTVRAKLIIDQRPPSLAIKDISVVVKE